MTSDAAQPLCLGLIGGLGPGATVEYYRALVKAHADRQIPLRLLIAHADMNYVVRQVKDGAKAALAGYFSSLISQLRAAGAQIAAVSAITPHMCADELAAMSPLPLVDPIEETAREIRAQGLHRVGLLGTGYVMESGLFGRLKDFDVVAPVSAELEFVHDTYTRLAAEGVAADGDYSALRSVAMTLCERDGAQAVVLAGTDLALVFNESNTDFPHIDCTRVHIEAIMRRLFAAPQ